MALGDAGFLSKVFQWYRRRKEANLGKRVRQRHQQHRGQRSRRGIGSSKFEMTRRRRGYYFERFRVLK